MKRVFLSTLMAVSMVFIFAGSALADSVQYTFTGQVTTGLLNGTALDGAFFTATGQVINEIDLDPASLFGLFAATTTYDFGLLGSFTTDVGMDTYFQFQSGTTQLGLVQGPGAISIGFRLNDNSPFTLTDPNIPEVTGPLFFNDGVFGGSRTQTNLFGDTLTLAIPDFSGFNPNINVQPGAQPVPEPSTLLLFGTGVLGLIGYARRRRNLTQ